MNMVDNLARKNAETKVREIVGEIGRSFDCPEGWMKSWGPRFMSALVGKGQAPNFTGDQIGSAFETLMETYKYAKPPKPAHVAELARELRPLPALQKTHNDPAPQRKWTPEERAANIAMIEAIQAVLASQEPEFRQALHQFGYDSPELEAVNARHKRELKAEVERLTKVFLKQAKKGIA